MLAAVYPGYGIALLATHPSVALTILGAVFLVLTGAEALYADMGHFGKQPVRLAWFILVWPGLLLSYFGQGAMLLHSTERIVNPFFALAPVGLLPAFVVLATHGDDHRLAGHDLGRVLRHAPGGATRPAATRENHADGGRRARPDLRAGGQHGHVRRSGRLRGRFWLVGCTVRRVRRVGRRRDADHHFSRFDRRAYVVALVIAANRRRIRRVSGRRSHVRSRQRHQDRARRLGAADARS